MAFVELATLEAAFPKLCAAPADGGVIEMIVARPAPGERRNLSSATLDLALGLVGDSWRSRGSSRQRDGSAHPDMQITLMNARVIDVLAGDRSRWSLAGDQFYVDMDLSETNVPPGTRLALGSAVLKVTAEPHLGCRKFSERFGPDAVKFVNSGVGKTSHLRGINARIVIAGEVAVGEQVFKCEA